MVTLNIAKEFSKTPGARTPEEGSFSGQEFRQNFLLPKLKEAISKGEELLIDLDGSAGYGSSFLEEVFGGLIRIEKFDYQVLKNTLKIKSDEDDTYEEEIFRYIYEASGY